MNDFNDARRAFLSRLAAGLGAAALGLAASAQAGGGESVTEPMQPAADTGHDYPAPAPHAATEKQFRMGVMGPAVFSRFASEIAVFKAADPAVKEFANFELRETMGVLSVLESLNTPIPPLGAGADALLLKLQSSRGADFDKAYIKAQLASHEFLRDLAAIYLKNSAGHTSVAERHGRHLATLALGTFKEHVVHCKDISATFPA